ncbi:MAG: dihydropteroate synthase [Rhodospirillaceae bacterium]|nr:dihydropteroate synthase [Rhodospirillaceae bacterium]
MGILNPTPDSFSDGGLHETPDAALAHAERLLAAGADFIDIGGESTRPGATPVAPEVELDRVMPALRRLAADGRTVSIDTRNASVMRAALGAGAAAVNDVSALTHDPDSFETVRRSGAPVILMHMKGDPATMNDDPRYGDVVAEVADALGEQAERFVAAGLMKSQIAIDPGLGFGKSHRHNLALLHDLDRLTALGYPVCIGASRKLAALTAPSGVRLAASTAAAVLAAQKGAAILRVHDVAETRVALRIAGFAMPRPPDGPAEGSSPGMAENAAIV